MNPELFETVVSFFSVIQTQATLLLMMTYTKQCVCYGKCWNDDERSDGLYL